MTTHANKSGVLAAAVVTVLALPLTAIPAQAEDYFSIQNGELQCPTGYRKWVDAWLSMALL